MRFLGRAFLNRGGYEKNEGAFLVPTLNTHAGQTTHSGHESGRQGCVELYESGRQKFKNTSFSLISGAAPIGSPENGRHNFEPGRRGGRNEVGPPENEKRNFEPYLGAARQQKHTFGPQVARTVAKQQKRHAIQASGADKLSHESGRQKPKNTSLSLISGTS